MTVDKDWVYERVRGGTPLWIGAATSIVLFLFGIRLLGTTTEVASSSLEIYFGRHIASDGRAFGVSWLATYAMANGSVIAALSVSLYAAEILTGGQLFLMVAGSRLGAAGVVVLIGTLDYLQKRRYTFGRGISLGLLAFLVTHSIYLPATAVGYLLVPFLESSMAIETGADRVTDGWPVEGAEPATGAIVDAIGVWPSFGLALVALLAGLHLFDRTLKGVDTDRLRRRWFQRLRRPWVGFGLGLLLTGVTTSIAFSLGVIVPLFNRGYLKRREVVPYVLGANVGTLFDTFLVAVILESPGATVLVGSLLALSLGFTVVALLWFRTYVTVVDAMQTRLVEDRRYLVAFLGTLLLVPLLIITFFP